VANDLPQVQSLSETAGRVPVGDNTALADALDTFVTDELARAAAGDRGRAVIVWKHECQSTVENTTDVLGGLCKDEKQFPKWGPDPGA
jgi:hypothetical protein